MGSKQINVSVEVENTDEMVAGSGGIRVDAGVIRERALDKLVEAFCGLTMRAIGDTLVPALVDKTKARMESFQKRVQSDPGFWKRLEDFAYSKCQEAIMAELAESNVILDWLGEQMPKIINTALERAREQLTDAVTAKILAAVSK